MRVPLGVVFLMRPLIAISIAKSRVYQIRAIAMKFTELHIVVYFFRLDVCLRFYWYLYLVYEVHIIVEIYIRNGCKNVPCVWRQ